MDFFNSAGISLFYGCCCYRCRCVGVWGIINLMEGYGGDNPASKSQGVKQLMAGGGVNSPGPLESRSPAVRLIQLRRG